jgi:hypothetical protein
MVDLKDKIRLEFAEALAKVCFENGVRRAKVGDLEIEMACVKNLNFQEPQPEAGTPEAAPRAALPKDLADWEDALGGGVPYVRRPQ